MTFEPNGVPGLYLGLSRVFYEYVPAEGLGVGDLGVVLEGLTKNSQVSTSNPLGEDLRDQILSLYWRWVIPSGGVEFYGEWARNDHSANVTDFLLEPEHSQGLTLGFQKTFGQLDAPWRLELESTSLEQDKTVLLRDTPIYYVHHIVHHGYTQDGQVLGAGIGPGSAGQWLALDRFASWGRVGGYVERVVHNNDAYYARVGTSRNFSQHDVGVSVGVRALLERRPVAWNAEVELTHEINRYFTVGNNLTNLRLVAGGRMHWGGL